MPAPPDFDRLSSRLAEAGIAALIADFDSHSDDPVARLVQSALRLSAGVLAGDRNQLAGQLLARLISVEHPEIQALVGQAARWRGAPWLRPLRPGLAPAGSPRMLKGHWGAVFAVAITPDGRRAVSGSEDATLKVWDLPTGENLRTLEGHDEDVRAVAVTPDGRRAVSGSWDGAVKVWDLETGACLRTLEGHSAFVSALAVVSQTRAVSGSGDHTLKLWDLEAGTDLLTLRGHEATVTAVAVSPDGRRALSGSADNTVRVWSLENGTALCTLAGHRGAITSVAFAPDGARVVSASEDSTLKVWDLASGLELRTIGRDLWGDPVAQRSLALAPGGCRAVSGRADGILKVWDLETGEEVYALEGHQRAVLSLAVSACGRWLVSGSADGAAGIWDLKAGPSQLRVPRPHGDAVTKVGIAADCARAVSGSRSGWSVWDLENDRASFHPSPHTAWAVTPGGRVFERRPASLWLRQGEEFLGSADREEETDAVAVTPDGRWLAAECTNSECRYLELWDVERRQVRTLKLPDAGIAALALTPDGRFVAWVSCDDTVRVWERDAAPEAVVLAADTGTLEAIAITADAKWVITGSYDGTVAIYDRESGARARTLSGHAGPVPALAVTEDGRRILSGSYDNTLRLWDRDSGELLAAYSAEAGITACNVAPDGLTIIAGDALGGVHFLRFEGGKEARL